MQVDEQKVMLHVVSIGPVGACPCCQAQSRHIHSWYERRLQDLPWQGYQVQIVWRSRRFFCDNPQCERRIFTERLSEVAKAHSRRTSRLMLTLRMIGLACGRAVCDLLRIRMLNAA